MRIVVAVVGKPRNAALATAIHDYESRAARYWPLDVIEVREEPARSLSPADVRSREATRLDAKLPTRGYIVACDQAGQTLTSESFAAWLQRQREDARDVGFVIGGAYGLGDIIRARAGMELSLAPWTLPHELARLVLVEQLYRAGTIARREPYHK